MQSGFPASVIRGGTSRGVFIRLTDLPRPGSARDSLLLEMLGSPDPIQVDGLGGGHSHTSKVMAVGPSTVEAVDVDYLFAQVDVRQPVVDYGGNCGNLTAAVAVYAIEEGIVEPGGSEEAIVVLRCLNTQSRVRVRVPLIKGRARVQGTYRMAGIPRLGAEIRVDYLDPEGGMLRSGALPLGQPVTSIRSSTAGSIEVSVVDVTSPLIIVRAADLGLDPPFVPEMLNRNERLLDRIEAIRDQCAYMLGMIEEQNTAQILSPSQPKVALVAPATRYQSTLDELIEASQVDLIATMSSVQRIHHAFAGTGVMCLAAAARIPGTLAAEMAGPVIGDAVRIGHPKGVATAAVEVESNPADGMKVASVGVSRTARVIMRGEIFHRLDPRDS